MPRKRVPGKTRSLRRLLDNPALPALIQSLSARELAQLCGRIGVGDAMYVMELAPAERLVQALDASVWKTPRPGLSEVFDPRELVEWICAWLDVADAFAAERLAAVPDEDLTLYLSQLATVTTTAMWGFERSTEIGDLERIYAPSDHEMAYGPFVVSARKQEDWEILREALNAMWSDAPERLLHLFEQLSGDESMLAPQRNRESSNDDVVSRRERARERCGYVTASGARAFLALARRPVEELAALAAYDLETQRHLARLADERRRRTDSAGLGDADNGPAQGLPSGPHDTETEKEGSAGTHRHAVSVADKRRLAALQMTMQEAGLLDPAPKRLLLGHDATTRRLPIAKLLQALAEQDAAAFEARGQELAYLGSVLIAGISAESAALSPTEARSAAVATCNLGLETLTAHGERVRIDSEPGLVRLFLVGYSVLSTLPGRVVDAFAQCLGALEKSESGPLHEWLVEQAQISVGDLREAVAKADFEAAQEATMALCFVFEPRTCEALMPLLGELPRLRTPDSEAAMWIDSVAAIETAAQLLRSIAGKRRRSN